MNRPGEYRNRITRAAHGERLTCTLNSDRKIATRTAGPPTIFVVLQIRDLDDFPIGRGDQQARLLRNLPRRIAKEIHDQAKQQRR